MKKSMELYNQKRTHMIRICEEAGFVELKDNPLFGKGTDLLEDTGFMAGILLEKKTKAGELFIPKYNYKHRNCNGIIYKDENCFSSMMISIENPLEFNSDDIMFICDSIEEMINEIKPSHSLISKNIHILIRENKKNTTHTVKRKEHKDRVMKLNLNVGKRIHEIKFGNIVNFLGMKVVEY
jgi:hypothetical protein